MNFIKKDSIWKDLEKSSSIWKYLGLLILFTLFEIGLALYLTYWRESFWNSVVNKEAVVLFNQMLIFLIAALVIGFVSGVSGYLVSLTSIKWRERLNTQALNNTISNVENINQRVQEDCMVYPNLVLNLFFGFLKAIVYIVIFSISFLYSFKGVDLILLAIYTVIGSYLTNIIAKPLRGLNYYQQRAEATYRQTLSLSNFKECLCFMLGIAKKTKGLTYFQQFYSQVGVVIPLIIILPQYLSTSMTIGVLMRFNSLSSTILDNMSYGINNFVSINQLISCRRRLKEANII